MAYTEPIVCNGSMVNKGRKPSPPAPPQRFAITVIAYRECEEHVTAAEVEEWVNENFAGCDMNRIEHVHVREVDATNADGRDLADL